MRIKIWVLFVTAPFLCIPALWANTPLPLTAKLELLDVNENGRISVALKFTLQNNAENPVEMLKWGTPLEGEFTRDTFNIVSNGERTPYIGKVVKRAAPQAKDYIEIPGKGELSEIVFLEDGYKIYAPGVYTVAFIDAPMQIKTTLKSMTLTPAASDGVEFEIIYGTSAELAASPTPPKRKCSNSQSDTFQSALSAAQNIAAVARRALHNAPVDQRPQARRYLEWYGAYNESRYAKATSNFDSVYDALFNKSITSDCPSDCPDAFAYVYPDQPYVIYFCDAFFQAPLTGTDSKAGTIIHELTHFTVMAGTDDVVYGQSGARNLARTDPDTAIKNADNYEYFAENTPPLPMSSGGGDGTGSSGGCFVQSLIDSS